MVRAVTPCFLGADPAVSPLLGSAPLRPLAGAEDLARDLVRSLDPGQGARAILLDRAPSVWRDPAADFGYDVLGAHLAEHHLR